MNVYNVAPCSMSYTPVEKFVYFWDHVGVVTKVEQSFFRRCRRKNFNWGQYMNIKRLIFLLNKFQINYGVFVTKIT